MQKQMLRLAPKGRGTFKFNLLDILISLWFKVASSCADLSQSSPVKGYIKWKVIWSGKIKAKGVATLQSRPFPSRLNKCVYLHCATPTWQSPICKQIFANSFSHPVDAWQEYSLMQKDSKVCLRAHGQIFCIFLRKNMHTTQCTKNRKTKVDIKNFKTLLRFAKCLNI